MSSSTIRKAIGVVKDQTSISIAKVAGNVAPGLEVLIVKATGHDIEPAEEKYIREILHLISQSRGYVSACVYNISKRLSKTSDWVVALKALMLVHRLLVDGSPVFGQEIMFASRKGTRVLNMSDFRVEALSNYWDHSAFVKNYALYLDQKLEFIAFERNLSGYNDKWRSEDRYGEFRHEHNYGFYHKSKSYGDLYDSIARKETTVRTPLKEMKPDRLLERLSKLLRVVDRGILCRPAGSAKTNKMILVALHLVLRESFRVYADIWEALGVLLDRLPEMDYTNGVKTFDHYVDAAKTIDGLFDFFKWSKDLGVARASEFPEVLKITDKILGTLERFLREKKNRLNKGLENGPSSGTTPSSQTTGDLLNLKDEVVPDDSHGNQLELALFSGPPAGDSKSSWEPFTSTAVENGKSDWELALVESASNLSTQKVNTGGPGIDPVMLNGIYDNGNPVSGIGRIVTPVTTSSMLALPAPSEPIQKVDPLDPFAASLMVPPPPYVQLADLEKKQSFLVQEQQVWQPYGNGSNGMLGLGQVQGPMEKMNGGVGGFNGMGQQQHAGYNYAHY
ncbi:hypothetical protein L2E82_03228 [Cichorium intybus]|uniref:Uncharacterized protein n=1 Tax=Cichorium intybus TaxID=13427 RepID=A0ACB9H3H1_CICIN|nr:hypothetical protein L2E82_03228 [Cichorium intybus]